MWTAHAFYNSLARAAYLHRFPTKNVLCQHTAYLKGRTGTFSGAASALINNYNRLEVVGYQTWFIQKDKNVVLQKMRRNLNLIMRLNSQNFVAKYEIHVGGNWRGIKYGTFCLNKQDYFSRHLFNIQSTFTEGSNDTVKNSQCESVKTYQFKYTNRSEHVTFSTLIGQNIIFSTLICQNTTLTNVKY